MLHLSENAVSYMERVWNLSCSDQFGDVEMFWDTGEVELCAKRLVNAGAVDPICKEAREMIRVAKSIDSNEERKIIDKLLKDYKTFECVNCNAIHFVYTHIFDDGEFEKNNCTSCDKEKTLKLVNNKK